MQRLQLLHHFPTSPAAEGADANPWKHIFEGEPRTLTGLVAKYGETSSTISAPGSSGFVIKVVEGPKFFLCAPVAGTFDCNEGPVLSHGAGSWLLDTKAEKMLQDSPDKAHVAKFESDQHLCKYLCILEAGSHLMYEWRQSKPEEQPLPLRILTMKTLRLEKLTQTSQQQEIAQTLLTVQYTLVQEGGCLPVDDMD